MEKPMKHMDHKININHIFSLLRGFMAKEINVNVTAKKIGGAVGEITFHVERGIKAAQRVGGVIFEAVNAVSPLSTNTFTISDRFEAKTKKVLTQAVTKSNLPEGVFIANPRDANPPQPFAVVTLQPSTEEAIGSFDRGAIKYATMDFNVDRLIENLTIK